MKTKLMISLALLNIALNCFAMNDEVISDDEAIHEQGVQIQNQQTILNQQLLDACQKNNLTLVEQLIQQGADVNASIPLPRQGIFDQGQSKPLEIACKNQNSNLAELLLKYKAQITYEIFKQAIKSAEIIDLFLNNGFILNPTMLEEIFNNVIVNNYSSVISVLQKHKLPLNKSILEALCKRFCKNNQDELVNEFFNHEITLNQTEFDLFINNLGTIEINQNRNTGNASYNNFIRWNISTFDYNHENKYFKNIYDNIDDHIEDQKLIGLTHGMNYFEQSSQVQKYRSLVASKINPSFDNLKLFVKKLSEKTGLLALSNNLVKCLLPVLSNPLIDKYYTDQEYSQSKLAICVVGALGKLNLIDNDAFKEIIVFDNNTITNTDASKTFLFDKTYGIQPFTKEITGFVRYMELAIIHDQLDVAKALIAKKVAIGMSQNKLAQTIAEIKNVINSIIKMKDSVQANEKLRCDWEKNAQNDSLRTYGLERNYVPSLQLIQDQEIYRLDAMQQNLKYYLCSLLYFIRIIKDTELPEDVIPTILDFCPKINWIPKKEILPDMQKEITRQKKKQ
jgi:hypothetical protein